MWISLLQPWDSGAKSCSEEWTLKSHMLKLNRTISSKYRHHYPRLHDCRKHFTSKKNCHLVNNPFDMCYPRPINNILICANCVSTILTQIVRFWQVVDDNVSNVRCQKGSLILLLHFLQGESTAIVFLRDYL